MSLALRLNLLITLLFISLFICSNYYIIANARTAVHREVESTAELTLSLIQLAISSESLRSDTELQLKILDRLIELDETRHLHIYISKPTEILTPVKEYSPTGDASAPAWFVKLVQPPPTELRRWLYNPLIPPTGIVIRADPSDESLPNRIAIWTKDSSLH